MTPIQRQFIDYLETHAFQFDEWVKKAQQEGPQTLNRTETALPFNIVITKTEPVYAKIQPQIELGGRFRKKKDAIELLTGEYLARLVANRPNPLNQVRLQREYDILLQLKGCRGVAQVKDLVIGHNKRGEETWTLYETSYGGGDVFDLLYRRLKLTEESQKMIFLDLLEGLSAIHQIRCVHRDIRPENIFIAPSEVVIGDFNLALQFENEDHQIQFCDAGAISYLPPEKLEMLLRLRKKWSYADERAADVWGLGCVLYLLRHGHEKHIQKEKTEGLQDFFRRQLLRHGRDYYYPQTPLPGTIDWVIYQMFQPQQSRPPAAEVHRLFKKAIS